MKTKSLDGKRILFFAPQENVQLGGVFASQVLGLARYCARLGAECLIFHHAEGEVQDCIPYESGIRLLSKSEPWVKTNVFTVVRAVEDVARRYWQQLVNFKPTHIYTRNYAMCIGSASLARATGSKMVYSMRGPDAYERICKGRWRDRLAGVVIDRLVRRAVVCCDVFTSMSQASVDWVAKRYGKEGIVIPCCVTDSFFKPIDLKCRESMRREFGFLPQHIVIAWCGSAAYWQCLDRVVPLLKDVAMKNERIRVLFLSNQPDTMKELCANFGFDEHFWRVRRVMPSEVCSYLQMCDVGLDILAIDDFKSSICCPVKVGEYLAAGLPVLITRTMGDMPALVQRFGAGALLGDALSSEEMEKQLQELPKFPCQQSICAARRFFSWESNERGVVQLFA